MKKNKKVDEFLEQLKKTPIVQVAVEKVGLSRNSVYRWRKEDPTFAKDMDEALQEGEDLVNDISESQLLTMIKDKEWAAISFWLRHRNPKYKERMEITAKIEDTDSLTPEQEAIVRHALQLAGSVPLQANEIKDHGKNTNDSARTG
jgi:ACT domain-containing protein